MKKNIIMILIFIFIIFTISYSYAGQVDLRSAFVYYSNITGRQQTYMWGAIIGNLNSVPYDFTTYAMDRVAVPSGNIYVDDMPGGGIVKNKYNLISLRRNISFNIYNVTNTSSSDLMPGILFPTSMYGGSDAPNNTFSCAIPREFNISGVTFEGCYIDIAQNSVMGLLKYCTSSCEPLYIVDLKSAGYSCYNSTSCDYQFMVPTNTTHPYYFYYVSKFPEYNITAWIDSVESWTMSQTAQPYIVDLRVTNIYTGEPAANVSVAIGEYEGNNIFVPLRSAGFVSKGMSIGLTDSDGNISYVVSPSQYPEITDYSLFAAVLEEDEPTKFFNFSITNSLSIEYNKKSLSPSELSDNAKVAVNAMNQIVNSLYIWANNEVEAKTMTTVVYTNGTVTSNLTIQTGAPNRIMINLKNTDGSTNLGTVTISEDEGYLVFSPVYHSSSLSNVSHKHYFSESTGTYFIITPTSYGVVDSNVTFEIYDSSHSYVTSIDAVIDSNLEPRSGSFYNNDELKVIINAMASVINSLYYALN